MTTSSTSSVKNNQFKRTICSWTREQKETRFLSHEATGEDLWLEVRRYNWRWWVKWQ